MWVFFREDNFQQFSEAVQVALRGLDPDLLIGEPARFEDDQGRVWLAHSDGRWSQIQVAMLACSLVNIQKVQNLDFQHVEDGEVTDREAHHQQLRTYLEDDMPPPKLLVAPEDVSPSDPEVGVTLQDVFDAQKPSPNALTNTLRLVFDTGPYERVDEQA